MISIFTYMPTHAVHALSSPARDLAQRCKRQLEGAKKTNKPEYAPVWTKSSYTGEVVRHMVVCHVNSVGAGAQCAKWAHSSPCILK